MNEKLNHHAGDDARLAPTGNHHPRRILVVEDSPTQAQQLAFVLEEAGFEVVTAPDAEEGYARLIGGQFDLVLTDLMLPGESGFELCRRIKHDRAMHCKPVVILTSQADPLNVLRGLEAGADGFMTKDRPPTEVVGRVRRTLESNGKDEQEPSPRPARVAFLDCEFQLAATHEQLLNVLLAAFEDVVHLNQQYQRSEAELMRLNVQLRQTVRSEQQALEQLKKAQSQLVQAEKLSSLGQMVAGVAHEINNPLTFVANNLTVLQRDSAGLRDLLTVYREGEDALAVQRSDLVERARGLAEEIDLDYTLNNLEGLMTRSREGLQRIQQIVRGLKDFARLDEGEVKAADLNDGICSTIEIVRPQARKMGVEIALDLGSLPQVVCQPAKINQVVMNLVQNALDACAGNGTVTVQTRALPGGVQIHVVDTGRGIDPAIRGKIFDPFFTTKPPGKGTGLGLSISYGIVQDHGGRITFDSTPGKGTEFVVHLPSKRSSGGA